MYHLNFEGAPYEMGQKLGVFFKEKNTKFPIKLNKHQIKYGKESIGLLEQFFPEATEEIKGITDKINYDYELFASWMKKIKFETIWSSVFDITDKKIYLAEGNPMDTEYAEDKRLKFSY